MKFSSVLPLALAFALVGGCTLAPGAVDFTGLVGKLPLTAAQKTLATQYVQDLTLALQADSDQTASELISQNSLTGYSVMAGPKVKDRAPKLKEKMEALKTKAKARLDKRKNGMTISPVVETWNEARTEVDRTVTMTKTNGVAITRVVTRHFHVDGENEELVSILSTRTMTHKNGVVFASERLKEINADGTYKVTYDSTLTRKDGKVKTIHWIRTGSAEGVETLVEGTLTRFDGTVVDLAAAKAADGTSTVSLTSDGVSVAATQNESTEQVDVTVIDPATNQSETQTVTVPEDGTPVAEPTEN